MHKWWNNGKREDEEILPGDENSNLETLKLKLQINMTSLVSWVWYHKLFSHPLGYILHKFILINFNAMKLISPHKLCKKRVAHATDCSQ